MANLWMATIECIQKFTHKFSRLEFFTSAEQIHSNIVTDTNTQSEFEQEHKCDGLITREVNKALIIRTADCVPVFIFSHQSISLLHAGHKGIQSNILEKWNEYCPDQPSYLILGDHIKSCCFKVHEDIEKKFRALPYSDPYSITKINKNQWSISLARILTISGIDWNIHLNTFLTSPIVPAVIQIFTHTDGQAKL